MVFRVDSHGFSPHWHKQQAAPASAPRWQDEMGLDEAVATLASYADSRHSPFISDRELVDIAVNAFGQFAPELQQAAQVRFSRRREFDRARDQYQRHHCPAGARLFQHCYRHVDLQGIGRLLAERETVVRSVQACAFGVLQGLIQHTSRSMPQAGEFRLALEEMAIEIARRGEQAGMSFERLLAMEKAGRSFAIVMLDDLRRLHQLFHVSAPRNRTLSAAEVAAQAQRMKKDEPPGAAAASPAWAQPAPEPGPEPAGTGPVITEVQDEEGDRRREAARAEWQRQEVLQQQRLQQEREREAREHADILRQARQADDIRRAEVREQEILAQARRQQDLQAQQRQDTQDHPA